MAALPLLKVDWDLVSDQESRDLLAALNFEATYDPTKRELTIRVTLVPELTHPDGNRAPLLSVPPAGTNQKGTARPALSRREQVINGAFSVPTTPWTRQTRSAGAASS